MEEWRRVPFEVDPRSSTQVSLVDRGCVVPDPVVGAKLDRQDGSERGRVEHRAPPVAAVEAPLPSCMDETDAALDGACQVDPLGGPEVMSGGVPARKPDHLGTVLEPLAPGGVLREAGRLVDNLELDARDVKEGLEIGSL